MRASAPTRTVRTSISSSRASTSATEGSTTTMAALFAPAARPTSMLTLPMKPLKGARSTVRSNRCSAVPTAAAAALTSASRRATVSSSGGASTSARFSLASASCAAATSISRCFTTISRGLAPSSAVCSFSSAFVKAAVAESTAFRALEIVLAAVASVAPHVLRALSIAVHDLSISERAQTSGARNVMVAHVPKMFPGKRVSQV